MIDDVCVPRTRLAELMTGVELDAFRARSEALTALGVPADLAADALVRAVRGPIILITIGTLFALDHFTPWGFQQTWPVILIVIGALAIAACSQPLKLMKDDSASVLSSQTITAQNPAEKGSFTVK